MYVYTATIKRTPDQFRLGADIERSRKDVEELLEQRRRTIEVAKVRQMQTAERFNKIKEKLVGAKESERWTAAATEEFKTLERIKASIYGEKCIYIS